MATERQQKCVIKLEPRGLSTCWINKNFIPSSCFQRAAANMTVGFMADQIMTFPTQRSSQHLGVALHPTDDSGEVWRMERDGEREKGTGGGDQGKPEKGTQLI